MPNGLRDFNRHSAASLRFVLEFASPDAAPQVPCEPPPTPRSAWRSPYRVPRCRRDETPHRPDSETVWCAANHLCRTLFRRTLQLIPFEAPALCCHCDLHSSRKLGNNAHAHTDEAHRHSIYSRPDEACSPSLVVDHRARSNVKRRRGEKRIIWSNEMLKSGILPEADKTHHEQHGNSRLGRNYTASPADERRRYSSA